jgi:hypothetical protein
MQEPSGAISSREASPGAAPVSSDDEVANLERLLTEKSREASALGTELARHRRLLREALERLGTTTSVELAALRRSRDAAVQRAIEAELGRAALAFELDETRAGLQTVPASEAVRELRGLYARVAQLEEADEAQRARLLLADHDGEFARLRIQQLERQLVEENERFELTLMRIRKVGDIAPPATSGLRGQLDGTRARMIESEQAFRSAFERAQNLAGPLREVQDELAKVHAESAELAVLCQARGAEISALGRELGREQQAVRSLEGQLGAAIEAQQVERRAREADVQAWMERLHELEAAPERQSEATHAAPTDSGINLQRWARELREFLGSVRHPLVQLAAALEDPSSGRVRPAMAHAEDGQADSTAPGTQFDAAAAVAFDDKLRASESRIAELEAALSASSGQAREGGLSVLKGELIDTRADAARLSDDLVKERTRRRKLVFTVRALQAASESGEAPGPWIEELIALLNEGASVPPSGH